MNDDVPQTTAEPDDDGGLSREPSPGQLPSDADVQAERQQEGVDAERAAAVREADRETDEPIHHDEGGDIGDGAD